MSAAAAASACAAASAASAALLHLHGLVGTVSLSYVQLQLPAVRSLPSQALRSFVWRSTAAQTALASPRSSVVVNPMHAPVIVKASSGPRYVVGCRNKVDKTKLTAGTRVALDMTTLTIMRMLPREVRCAGCLVGCRSSYDSMAAVEGGDGGCMTVCARRQRQQRQEERRQWAKSSVRSMNSQPPSLSLATLPPSAATPPGRPHGVQHADGGPGQGGLQQHRRPQRADPRAAREHRAAADEP